MVFFFQTKISTFYVCQIYACSFHGSLTEWTNHVQVYHSTGPLRNLCRCGLRGMLFDRIITHLFNSHTSVYYKCECGDEFNYLNLALEHAKICIQRVERCMACGFGPCECDRFSDSGGWWDRDSSPDIFFVETP